jgi:hypothetical protein
MGCIAARSARRLCRRCRRRSGGRCRGDQRAVVVEAAPATTLVVIESELALELAVVELDRPAQAGESGEPVGAGVLGQVGQPVVGRGVVALGPFDDQPLPARRQMVVGHGVRGDDAHEREATLDDLAGGGQTKRLHPSVGDVRSGRQRSGSEEANRWAR